MDTRIEAIVYPFFSLWTTRYCLQKLIKEMKLHAILERLLGRNFECSQVPLGGRFVQPWIRVTTSSLQSCFEQPRLSNTKCYMKINTVISFRVFPLCGFQAHVLSRAHASVFMFTHIHSLIYVFTHTHPRTRMHTHNIDR